jgi:ABC-type dipeptide/oligopeptide/nickel transport system permease component
MLTYIVRRVLYSIPVLIATSFLIFAGVSAIGDPLGGLKVNPLVSQQTIQHIEQEKHLNDSIPVQYYYWVKDAVTNKFGTPLLTNTPIWDDLKRVLPHTLALVIPAEIMALLLGVGIGIYSAIRQYSVFDYTATTVSFLGFAMPVFWLALMLQIAFTNLFLAWHVRIFYTSGLSSVDPGSGLHFYIDRAQHLAIPWMTLMLLSVAVYSRFMRASLLEVINTDYVRTARAKGLTEERVTMRHAVRNALIPVVTLAALNWGVLIGGAIVTESIFQLDGMGNYFITSLFNQDIYPIMAWLMVVAVMVILFNLIADILYGFLDPRVRYD